MNNSLQVILEKLKKLNEEELGLLNDFIDGLLKKGNYSCTELEENIVLERFEEYKKDTSKSEDFDEMLHEIESNNDLLNDELPN